MVVGFLFSKEHSSAEAVAAEADDLATGFVGNGQRCWGEPENVWAFATAGATFATLSKHSAAEGYQAFVAEHAAVLEAYVDVRDNQAALRVLHDRPALVDGVAHVRQWFYERHVEPTPPHGEKPSRALGMREEAELFFLVDSAAHAALRHYWMVPGTSVEAAALQGVTMLMQALAAPGDPVGVGLVIAQRVAGWLSVVNQHRRASTKPAEPPSTANATAKVHTTQGRVLTLTAHRSPLTAHRPPLTHRQGEHGAGTLASAKGEEVKQEQGWQGAVVGPGSCCC